MNIKRIARRIIKGDPNEHALRQYGKRLNQYSFTDCQCEYPEQFEASITRLYHTIEKGLSYENYRAGFGEKNINTLMTTLEQYAAKRYDISSFAYRTGLSCINAYIAKNRECGLENTELEERAGKLPGLANDCGGVITITPPTAPEKMTFRELMVSRHSIRHFSDQPVDRETLIKAIDLAQYTPSACNRQSWKTRIITDKKTIEGVLTNQNGNQGFGQEIDKLLIITADLRAQQKNRELFQAYIDGGMYAQNVLNSLFSFGIGSIPLSASLTETQEKNVRTIMKIDDAEVLIMFIGIGTYPESCMTARSERHKAVTEIL